MIGQSTKLKLKFPTVPNSAPKDFMNNFKFVILVFNLSKDGWNTSKNRGTTD